jgi:predicted MFS family arabinose efflux permease
VCSPRREGVLTLLVPALSVDYADRMLIGALGPTIEVVFHIDTTGLDVLAASFSVVAASAALPIGVLTDRANRTLLLAASLCIWAAAGLTGAASSFVMLFGARMLLGVVAATTGPTSPFRQARPGTRATG